MRVDRLPEKIVSGDSIDWLETETDYPATDYRIDYVFVAAGQRIELTGSAEGTDHLIEVDGAASAEYLPGTYRYQRYLIEIATDDRITLESGSVTIEPNFDEYASGYDGRTWAERTLEAVEALLADKATKDQASYSIAGRSLSRYSIAELQDLRNYCLRQIKRDRQKERVKAGKPSGNRILMRFPSGRI